MNDTIVTREASSVVKNITLDGVKALKAENVTTVFEIKRKLDPVNNQTYKLVSRKKVDEVVEPLYFDLVEVTAEDLSVYRKSGIPSFVLKADDKFYYTEIPSDISFFSNALGAHMCAVSKHECSRLSAATDEHGGCAKVRDRCQIIERYPWITSGYETFNTKHDSFVVINCLHYQPCQHYKTFSSDDVSHAKLSLAQFVWEDVTSRREVKKRIERNFQRYGRLY